MAVVELDDGARRVLGRRHPEVSGYGAALVVATAAEVRTQLVEAIERLAAAVNVDEPVDVDAMVRELSASDAQTAPLLESAKREAQFRVRLLRDYGGYRAADLAELGGSTASNRSQLAYRWRKEGRIFAVPFRGEQRYLAFQFDDDGQPLPAVAGVLATLDGWSPWRVAAWFVTANGLLDRSQPVALLTAAPDDVVAAARRDARAI